MDKRKELNKIKEDIKSNLVCPLKDQATNIVFGKGNADAQIMIIGEAPGEKEDLAGMPFVGRAGKQLDNYLNKINLSLDEVYIANILKYRPPKNRNPSNSEILSHTPYLVEQIKVIKPKLIITLGNYSSKFILSKFNLLEMKLIEGISKIQGNCFDLKIDDFSVKVIPMYHPAALLYKPRLKLDFENSLRNVAKVIGSEYKEEIQTKLI